MTDKQQQQQQQSPDRHESATRERREKLGLTRVQLAVKARCSVGALYLIEHGVTRSGIIRDKVDRVLADLEAAA